MSEDKPQYKAITAVEIDGFIESPHWSPPSLEMIESWGKRMADYYSQEYLPIHPANDPSLTIRTSPHNPPDPPQYPSITGFSAAKAEMMLNNDQILKLTERIEALKTRNAQILTELADGMESRLPTLAQRTATIEELE